MENLLLLVVLFSGTVFSQQLEDLSLETVEAALSSKCKLRELYEQYIGDHGLLRCRKEHSARYELFRNSLVHLRMMMRDDEVTWNVGLTPLSDLSEEEFVNTYLGHNGTANELEAVPNNPPSLEAGDIPEAFDWRNPNGNPKDTYVTPVQHQKECSCWARAAVVPLETQMKKLSGYLIPLSVFEIYDCTYGGENGYNGGTGGGTAKDAYIWLQRNGHLSSRADIADRPGNKPTHYMWFVYADRPNYFARFRLERIRWALDEGQIVSSVYRTSPVVVSMQMRGIKHLLKGYKGEPFFSNACEEGDGHAMAIVGYTRDTLIIKNSWGTRWGDKGYLMWKRGQPGWNCDMTRRAIYPELSYSPPEDDEQ